MNQPTHGLKSLLAKIKDAPERHIQKLGLFLCSSKKSEISAKLLFLSTFSSIKQWDKWLYGVGCSVAKWYPRLCDPVDCSMPGFPVRHLPECAPTHVHWVGDAIRSSHPLLPPFPLQSFPASGSFPVRWLFTSGGQSFGASASASVLPMNIQGWFPLGLTSLILLSMGCSGVFSSTTVWNHRLFSTRPSLWSNSHLYMTAGKS